MKCNKKVGNPLMLSRLHWKQRIGDTDREEESRRKKVFYGCLQNVKGFLMFPPF